MSETQKVSDQLDTASTVIERQQEELLKTKYPNLKPKDSSTLLQRRMSQKKYFDSGDYNMARAKISNDDKVSTETEELEKVTGNQMPTPDEMPRVRKLSQSTLVASQISAK